MPSSHQTPAKKSRVVRNSLRFFRQKIFPPLTTLGKLISIALSNRSYLKNKGFFKSAKAGLPIGRDGNPVPWMNYPIVDFFEERFHKELNMFEYGCGNSTQFYAKRLKHVTSLEGNQYWYDLIKPTLPDNVKLILVDATDKNAYLEAIKQENNKYDIVMVDAEHRNACAEQAIEVLSPGGVIIYDDSHRVSTTDPVFSVLEKNGFRKLTFRGLKPGSFSEYASTIFYRDGNCLNL